MRNLAPTLLMALLALGCGSSKESPSETCYSPTQNAEHAFEHQDQGCACEQTPANEAGFCVGGAGFICEDNVWQAVEDGPCLPPELISADACTMKGGEVPVDGPDAGVPDCALPTIQIAAVMQDNGTALPCCKDVADRTCYSPSQNLDKASDSGAKGCACELDGSNKYGFCIRGTGLVCEEGKWLFADDPCLPISAETCTKRGGEVLGDLNGEPRKDCPAELQFFGTVTSQDGTSKVCCEKQAR